MTDTGNGTLGEPIGRAALNELLRISAPRVLAALVARYRQFDACEDAVQEALLAASVQWQAEGLPEHPVGWLVTVASRRLADSWRANTARQRREATVAAELPTMGGLTGSTDESDRDDTLGLLFLCCTPALPPASQVALALRAVGGLTTREIAGAFLVPEATMTRRISRAKQRLVGATFGRLTVAERRDRLAAVLQVLYLIFNEGYTATAGPSLHRVELSAEAIRLCRDVHRALPDDGEVTGLLALMLLTDARRPARTTADGGLVPLAEQDRSRWNADQIREGIALLERALPRSKAGPYQVQAAIAAVHDEAKQSGDTDWPQIVALYDLLERFAPNPVVTLNRAVAVAMAQGPAAGFRVLASIEEAGGLHASHRVSATRAHLLEMSGDAAAARTWYATASRQATSLPEQRYLTAQVARLAQPPPPPSPQTT